jgi:PadR family transcriptional regulator PadR
MHELTKLEEAVMMAIWQLEDDSYGVEIRKRVNKITGKDYFYNTLYTTFTQLERKGFIIKHFGEPTAVRGGKRKVYFHITEEGMKALENAYERQNRLWQGITKESFNQDYA